MTHDAGSAPYELFYWPTIQGRGEVVRLALEDAGVAYVDVARLPPATGGIPAMMKVMKEHGAALRPLAPPFLRKGEVVIAQTAAILHWLAPRIGLCPDDEEIRTRALQIQLTLWDVVSEAHDVHHPVSTGLYFEDQKDEAKRAAASFTKDRIPKFLGWLESVLEAHAKSNEPYLAGPFTYVDLSAYWVVTGLAYAFPTAMARHEKAWPRLRALRGEVAARPNIAAYLASSRCAPWNEDGIFRHYAELDPLHRTPSHA